MAGQSPSIFKHRRTTASGDFKSSDKTSSGSNDDEPSVYGLFVGGDIFCLVDANQMNAYGSKQTRTF